MIRDAALTGFLTAHRHVVAAVVIGTRGSTPRETGAVMLIHAEGSVGTVGGGSVEVDVLGRAREMLKAGTGSEWVDYPLGPDLDQCCGGNMRVAIGLVGQEWRPGRALWQDGPVLPDDAPVRQVMIYGAGHVGTALARALAPLPFSVTLIDTRPPEHGGDDHDGIVRTALPEALSSEAAPDAFHLVLTHSHAQDLEIVAAVLARDFGFCGLIGSHTKKTLFQRRLAERGLSAAQIGRLTCPIGLPGLRDKRPGVIAASVAAQLLGLALGDARGGAADD